MNTACGRSVPRWDEQPSLAERRLVVGHSLRRLRAWGPRRTLLWYWDRRYAPDGPAAMDVR